jgi:predicted amidophosphoribosyltransferase
MISGLINLIYPKKCVFCGLALTKDAPINICGGCAAMVPYFAGEYLFESGRARGAETCDRIVCALKYTGFVRKTMSGFKFYDRPEYGKTLAALLCERIAREGGVGNGAYDLITCVPLSRARLRERGYNQAAVLARHTAGYLGLPFEGDLLVRDENALRQSTLKRGERGKNAQSAFRANEAKLYSFQEKRMNAKINPRQARQTGAYTNARGDSSDNLSGNPSGNLPLSGVRVILIDDIATSMSTINACAALLKSQGASEVLGAVLAAP